MRQNVACGLSRISNRPRVAYVYLPMFTYVDSERRPAASMFSSSSVICISADL